VAHEFDTGLAKPQRTRIREEIASALAGLLYTPTPTPAGYLRAIVQFAGTVKGANDADGIAMLYDVLQGRAPAVAISIGRKQYENAGATREADQWRATYSIDIYVASNQTRSRESRLSGDVASAASTVADPGVEVILEHVEELLSGRSLGVSTVYRLAPVTEDEVVHTNDMTIWSQSYQLRTQRDVNPYRDVTTMLAEVQALHYVDGMAAPSPLIDALSEIDP
jgi:phage gp37-like protein